MIVRSLSFLFLLMMGFACQNRQDPTAQALSDLHTDAVLTNRILQDLSEQAGILEGKYKLALTDVDITAENTGRYERGIKTINEFRKQLSVSAALTADVERLETEVGKSQIPTEELEASITSLSKTHADLREVALRYPDLFHRMGSMVN